MAIELGRSNTKFELNSTQPGNAEAKLFKKPLYTLERNKEHPIATDFRQNRAQYRVLPGSCVVISVTEV